MSRRLLLLGSIALLAILAPSFATATRGYQRLSKASEADPWESYEESLLDPSPSSRSDVPLDSFSEYESMIDELEKNPVKETFASVYAKLVSRPTMEPTELIPNESMDYLESQYELFKNLGLPSLDEELVPVPAFKESGAIEKILDLFHGTIRDGNLVLEIRFPYGVMLFPIDKTLIPQTRPTNLPQLKKVLDYVVHETWKKLQGLPKFPSDILEQKFVEIAKIIWDSAHEPNPLNINWAGVLDISLKAYTTSLYGTDEYEKQEGAYLRQAIRLFKEMAERQTHSKNLNLGDWRSCVKFANMIDKEIYAQTVGRVEGAVLSKAKKMWRFFQ